MFNDLLSLCCYSVITTTVNAPGRVAIPVSPLSTDRSYCVPSATVKGLQIIPGRPHREPTAELTRQSASIPINITPHTCCTMDACAVIQLGAHNVQGHTNIYTSSKQNTKQWEQLTFFIPIIFIFERASKQRTASTVSLA